VKEEETAVTSLRQSLPLDHAKGEQQNPYKVGQSIPRKPRKREGDGGKGAQGDEKCRGGNSSDIST